VSNLRLPLALSPAANLKTRWRSVDDRAVNAPADAGAVEAWFLGCSFGLLSLPMQIAVVPGRVTCRIWRLVLVRHEATSVRRVRFRVAVPGESLGIAFEGEHGRTVYVYSMYRQHELLIPVLQDAGFEVSEGVEKRWIRPLLP